MRNFELTRSVILTARPSPFYVDDKPWNLKLNAGIPGEATLSIHDNVVYDDLASAGLFTRLWVICRIARMVLSC